MFRLYWMMLTTTKEQLKSLPQSQNLLSMLCTSAMQLMVRGIFYLPIKTPSLGLYFLYDCSGIFVQGLKQFFTIFKWPFSSGTIIVTTASFYYYKKEVLNHVCYIVVWFIVLGERELTPLEREVKSARDRFDDIVSVLEARGINLESTLTRFEQYQVAYTDLITWLECAEDIQIKWTNPSNDLQSIVKYVHEFRVCIISVLIWLKRTSIFLRLFLKKVPF